MPQRSITITKQQDMLIDQAMRSGGYGNVSEVFREALRLWEKTFQPTASNDDLMLAAGLRGYDSWKAGQYTELNGPEDVSKFLDDIFDEERTAQT